jgi:hypothetical protein
MIAIGLLFVRMLYDFFKPRRRPNAKAVPPLETKACCARKRNLARRCRSGTSANAMFGGTAEYVALWLKSSDHEQWFAWYVSGMVAILAASLIMPDTRKYGYLEGIGKVERDLRAQ